MAMPEAVIQRWNALTITEQKQAVDFIDFLLLRRKQDEGPRKTHFQLDALAGGLEYIADDFDDTPEEFDCFISDAMREDGCGNSSDYTGALPETSIIAGLSSGSL